MAKYTRGEFLGFGAILAGAFTASRVPLEASEQTAPAVAPTAPDLIVHNAKVYTVEPSQPAAEAFAIKDGRFIAVGSNSDVKNLASVGTPMLDAGRMTIVPGFIDAHSHPSGVDELYGVNCNLRTVADILAAIKHRADITPPGYWIEAFMFDDTKVDRPLTRRELDLATQDHPVVVQHRGGHTAWYNSKALALAGINRETKDPPDGRFFRDETGALTGRVAENARGVFDKVGKRQSFTLAEQRDRARAGMRHMSELFAAAGLTSVHDADAPQEHILAYEDVKVNGELFHRANILIDGQSLWSAFKAAGVYTGFGDEWVRIGGVKYVADGSASERTMRMSTPYVGTTDYGILTMTQQQINDVVDDAHQHSFQVGIHANGDVTIDMVLKAYERALAKWPDPNRRHRIEHCSLINPDLVRRIKASGVIPTPFWTYIYYHGEKWKQYGDEKMQSMFAHKSFLDAGIPVPGASDYTPGPFEPMMAIQSMVTRKDYTGHVWGPNQKVTVDEALRIGTINGAWASHEERVKGSIAAGKYADFVILEKDPHDVDPDAIKDITINRTVLGGRTTFPKAAS